MKPVQPDNSSPPVDIFGMSIEEIAALPLLRGEPAFRARQIARWVYNRHGANLEEMTDLPLVLRHRLSTGCRIGRLTPSDSTDSGDGSATKYIFPLGDGASVEAVWIRDGRRDTLCISSQAGCAYGCTFCATAVMRAGRNLSPGEILSQVVSLRTSMASPPEPEVHNIVFMGMGEPLANYENLVRALRILTADIGYGIAARRITVSTVGLEPEIRRLARDPLRVRLAFSLNATTDDIRSKLMPINRKYPFRSVLRALRDYQEAKGAPVTLEYVLLRGINDTAEDARRLAAIARSLQCKVNLIAYNPHPHAPFESAPDEAIEAFRSRMLPITETTITVRWSKGRDIQAACGQLAVLAGRKNQ